MAERKIVSKTGLLTTFEIEVTDREVKKLARFDALGTADDFAKGVAAAVAAHTKDPKDEGLIDIHALYLYAADLKARAAAREAVRAESTVIKRDGKEIDLMKLPVEKGIAACNAAFVIASTVGGEPQSAFVTTRRKLLEAGKAVEQNGVLTLKK